MCERKSDYLFIYRNLLPSKMETCKCDAIAKMRKKLTEKSLYFINEYVDLWYVHVQIENRCIVHASL